MIFQLKCNNFIADHVSSVLHTCWPRAFFLSFTLNYGAPKWVNIDFSGLWVKCRRTTSMVRCLNDSWPARCSGNDTPDWVNFIREIYCNHRWDNWKFRLYEGLFICYIFIIESIRGMSSMPIFSSDSRNFARNGVADNLASAWEKKINVRLNSVEWVTPERNCT